MLRPRDALIWALFAFSARSLDAGLPLHAGTVGDAKGRRRLHGKFLHITDFHPDPFYKSYSSTEEDAACHRKRGPAGYYGAETSACDSSVALVNATMDWIRDNIADQVDFVIWTGDSARHDNDEKIPRTQKQVITQNEFMVHKITDVFGKGEDAIPVVPTFGNNDVLPHNILLAGPNKWTLKYLDIWKQFIPEEQRHQFQEGGWFWVEVIPGKLAVVSLNTMYFFSSNSGVDGCANKHEPGFEQFEWLRIQLQLMRDRGVSAILIGHIPPARVDSKESWEETCWQKFALWERQYRDVIVGSFFGHMNIDHFMLQDFKQIKKSTRKGVMTSTSPTKSKEATARLLEDGEVTVASASDYLLDLRNAWAKLPSPPSKKSSQSIGDYIDADEAEVQLSMWEKLFSIFSTSKKKKGNQPGKDPKSAKKTYLDKIGGKYAERYSVSLVSPSVVPNFFPTIRVLEYNITGLENVFLSNVVRSYQPSASLSDQDAITGYEILDDTAYRREVETAVKKKHKKKEKDTVKKPKQYKFKVPTAPSKSTPPGPAYSPQTLTLTGYTQYFANLTYLNNDFLTATESDTGPSAQTVFGLEVDDEGVIEGSKWKEGKHKEHQGKKPRPKPHPKKFRFEVEYDTKTDKRYKLKDLTVRSLVDLARRIGHDATSSGLAEWQEDDFSDEEDPFSDTEGDEVDGEGDESVLEAMKEKGKKGKKHKSKNSTWFTFVRRAFVDTMDPRDIESVFGASAAPEAEEAVEQQEIIEL